MVRLLTLLGTVVPLLALWLILWRAGYPERQAFLASAFLVGGVLCVLASLLDWDWFFEEPRVQGMVKVMGRRGARTSYFFLGLLLLGTTWLVLC